MCRADVCRIALVADSLILVGLLEMSLTDEGFHVVTISRMEELTEELAANPPDVVILDMTLPDHTRSEFCARACERHNISLILLAAPGLSEHRVKTGPLRNRCMLIKPFSFDSLIYQITLAMDSQRNVDDQRNISAA